MVYRGRSEAGDKSEERASSEVRIRSEGRDSWTVTNVHCSQRRYEQWRRRRRSKRNRRFNSILLESFEKRSRRKSRRFELILLDSL
jgi:hypothetical protein